MARVLVVDDEHSMRVFLEVLLSRAGHTVEVASDAASAIVKASAGEFDIVVTDLMLGRGGGSGLDVLSAVKKSHPETEVIVMTAYASDESDLSAMRMGAYDYVAKPFKKNDELVLLIEKALEKRGLAQREKSLTRDNELLREQLSSRARFEGMVGRSPAMMSVYSLVEKVAASRTTVLITGESGVGKELVARAVHAKSPRANASFLAVNCGAIPEGLIESELFGHVKGAFTGAAGAKEGLFQAAHGGTLFLDEIGELGLSLQVKLLRAIQDRRVRPVGATEDAEVDVRLVTATNRDLPEEVRAGRFREDLYYRLNVVQIRVPPLRDRREDIPLLARHFMQRGAEAGRIQPREFGEDALAALQAYSWPGNVRQ
ncbi:MAG: sigma-54-dependent transcriptional regulator, partial [Myxococcales bacterium]